MLEDASAAAGFATVAAERSTIVVVAAPVILEGYFVNPAANILCEL